MKVDVIIDNADYGKFSNFQLCYVNNGMDKKVTLSLLGYEKVFDFTRDFVSVKFDLQLFIKKQYSTNDILLRKLTFEFIILAAIIVL
ncbi:hypothetical protein [[Flexibacter] sp. ATCC 35208]|uniref:hypothetical protein n=1 Tax=[Flexibacter] sp. ATCC 35208 TaxID=1936242 RepID=UPI0009D07D8A|nr:hypothetical protein [[Flexibacter] sp. ATCC 35208]OMP79995.1 hypothetical protein BW716_07200 [[Flexibacter] sp. ATCC 35208]